jgi:hypothetical protein
VTELNGGGSPVAQEQDFAHARVHAALGALEGLDQAPLADHAPRYEALHDELQAVLAEIDGA